MCGHPRALATYYERPICRINVLANDRTRTRVTLSNFHGEEAVDVRVRQRAFQKICKREFFGTASSSAKLHRAEWKGFGKLIRSDPSSLWGENARPAERRLLCA